MSVPTTLLPKKPTEEVSGVARLCQITAPSPCFGAQLPIAADSASLHRVRCARNCRDESVSGARAGAA